MTRFRVALIVTVPAFAGAWVALLGSGGLCGNEDTVECSTPGSVLLDAWIGLGVLLLCLVAFGAARVAVGAGTAIRRLLLRTKSGSGNRPGGFQSLHLPLPVEQRVEESSSIRAWPVPVSAHPPPDSAEIKERVRDVSRAAGK